MHRRKGIDLVMHVYYHVGDVVALVLVCRRTFLYLMSVLAIGLVLMNLVYTHSKT